MIERRQYERNSLRSFARIYNRKLGRLIGYLVNITPGGVMIVSEKPIEPGAVVDLRIELPESIDSSSHLDVNAVCVWSRMDDESSFYEVGFKLQNLEEAQQESIDYVVSQYGF